MLPDKPLMSAEVIEWTDQPQLAGVVRERRCKIGNGFSRVVQLERV